MTTTDARPRSFSPKDDTVAVLRSAARPKMPRKLAAPEWWLAESVTS